MAHSELSNDLIKDTIESLANLLEEFYVFPEIAVKIRDELFEKLAEGKYRKAANGHALSEVITNQLLKLSNDLHLKLYFSEDVLPSKSNEYGSSEYTELRLKLNNYGFEKVERLPGNIGYLVLNEFAPPELAGETAANAMSFVGDTSGLIVDLRNNSGGTSFMVAFISSYLLDNSSPVHLNDLYWRSYNVTQSFWSLPFVPGKRFGGDKPICILTSNITCSAAEEFAYSLQALDRAQIIGEITKGGANPGGIHRINDHFQAFIPNGRAINPITKDNWEGSGVIPDLKVDSEEAFDIAYKTLLNKVLENHTKIPCQGEDQLIEEIKMLQL
ncbi:MAG TPA: S41 family peptidase [Candidatus Paenibacillus intestinavium]|nr:S41 family peptidase [Candidatus Paenibacillus intestinavium]